MPKTDQDVLASLGITADTKVAPPAGVDPHTMPVTDIVFEPSMLDDFPDLGAAGRPAASRHLFDQYKAVGGKNPDRNALLWRRIGQFISEVAVSRKTGGIVKEKVKTTAEERALAQLIASRGITAADLAALIQDKE